MNINDIIVENKRRNTNLEQPYDPIGGVGCYGTRVQCLGELVPTSLLEECPHYSSLNETERRRLRVRHDFEFWCATCVTIVDKRTNAPVRLRLNAPQRRVLAIMEDQRTRQLPVRIILLKARQWGGSTLVQMYMAWMQLVRHTGWNSLICGHIRQTSRAIKGMYKRLLRHYPQDLMPDGLKRMEFRNFEGSSDVQMITGRDCLVVMGSATSEDAVRGYNLSMAHLTEVAFWPSTTMHSPEDVMRTVGGTVTRSPETVVALESTANGVGHYFHDEWIRARAGQSDKVAVFVPWHEIEIYRSPVEDPQALWNALDDYERGLWESGCTLEMLQWYHDKRKEYATHAAMMAEFPSNDVEAFRCHDNGVFDLQHLENMRTDCRPPHDIGDIEADYLTVRNVHFVSAENGLMKVWEHPINGTRRNDYVVCVDVGGRWAGADYSVIAVFRTPTNDRLPELAAQWRGHIDHDLLAWKAAQIATYYSQALLVVESNTLETSHADTDAGGFILDRIKAAYRNIYHRQSNRVGFHTNAKTKNKAIYGLIAAVRDRKYIEHDSEAIDEMVTYEQKPNGSFQAKDGHHDDMLMTRAIALYVINEGVKAATPITDDDKQVMAGPAHTEMAPLSRLWQ